MEVRPDQLPRQLEAQPLARCYLLAGDEPLQVLEAADAVRARARREGFDEREVLHAEPGFDWGRLAAAGASLSLFSDKRILELHLPDKGPGKPGSAAIVDYAKNAPDTTLLIPAGADVLSPGDVDGLTSALREEGNRLVLVDPGISLGAFTDRLTTAVSDSPLADPDPVSAPACRIPAAVAAGDAQGGDVTTAFYPARLLVSRFRKDLSRALSRSRLMADLFSRPEKE